MIQVITNNDMVCQMMNNHHIPCVYLTNEAQQVLCTCRDQLLAGWRLAADPLAGYHTRFNPYHTLFLEKAAQPLAGEELAAGVLRLEQAVHHLNSPKRPAAENRPDIVQDYQHLDASIAYSTLSELLKYQAAL